MLDRLSKLFDEPCRHHNSTTKFFDLHTGGSGEWYVRGTLRCRDCDLRTSIAVRMPDSLKFDDLNKEQYYDEVRAGEHK